MNIDSFIAHVKSEDIYANIAGDVKKTFETSNYEVKRLLPTGKNKRKIRVMKYELCERIMKNLVALRPKM